MRSGSSLKVIESRKRVLKNRSANLPATIPAVANMTAYRYPRRENRIFESLLIWDFRVTLNHHLMGRDLRATVVSAAEFPEVQAVNAM